MVTTLEDKIRRALSHDHSSQAQATSTPSKVETFASSTPPASPTSEPPVSVISQLTSAAPSSTPSTESNLSQPNARLAPPGNGLDDKTTAAPVSLKAATPDEAEKSVAMDVRPPSHQPGALPPSHQPLAADATPPSHPATPAQAAHPISASDVADRLYRNATDRNRRLEEMRKATPDECTFTPTIKRNHRKPASENAKGDTFSHLYEDSKVRQQKLKDRVAEAQRSPAGCTFSPTTQGVDPRIQREFRSGKCTVSNVGAVQRTEILYEQSKQQKLKLDEARRAREEKEKPSFKPKITRRAKRAPSPGPAARMEQLYQASKGKDKELERMRREREMKGCTFTPKINRSRSIPRQRKTDGAAAANSPSAGTVQDRLNRYKEEVDKKKAELRRKQKQEEDKKLTFKPQIRASSRGRSRERQNGPPPSTEAIHGRLYNDARKKKQHLDDMKHKHDQALGFTFQPRINRAPRSQSARKSRPGEVATPDGKTPSVFERLVLKSGVSDEKQKKYEDDKLAREMQECTFTPKVMHRGSKTDAMPGSGKSKHSSPVWERLYQHEQESVVAMREELKKQQELENCTFKPDINTTPVKDASPGVDAFTRLAATSKADKAKALEEEKRKTELSQCTFKPSVNETSHAKVHARVPVWDRLQTQKVLPAKTRKVAEAVTNKEKSQCTFKPKVNPKSLEILMESPKIVLTNRKSFPAHDPEPQHADGVATSPASAYAQPSSPQQQAAAPSLEDKIAQAFEKAKAENKPATEESGGDTI